MTRTAVVVLNWNGLELLRRFLPAVLATLDDLAEAELIVADNGSDDGSREYLAKEYPAVRTLFFEKNLGYAAGYNCALGQIEAPYVVLLNSDVAPCPGWLPPLVEALDNDATVAAAQPKILALNTPDRFEYAGAAGGYLDRFGYPYCRGRVFNGVEDDCGQYDDDVDCHWASGAALLVRRQAFLDVGGLDPDFFAHMEEIDLCWRFRLAGYRVRAIGGSAVRHLGGGSLPYGNQRKVFLNFRNSLLMLVRDLRGWSWPLTLLVRMVLDGVAAAAFLVGGQPRSAWSVVRAHVAFYGNFSTAWRKRKEDQRRLGNREARASLARLSIVWRHTILRRRTYQEL